jgi:hypothetical protein
MLFFPFFTYYFYFKNFKIKFLFDLYIYLNKYYNLIFKKFFNVLFFKNKCFFFFPCKIKKYTVLRSPFIFKKTKEQFEFRFYKILYKFFFFYDFLYLKKLKKYLFFFFSIIYILIFKNNFFFIKGKEKLFLNF